MGFPIPYAGLLPRLLFTAAISIAAFKDLCTSLLQLLRISSSSSSSSSSSIQDSHYPPPHVQDQSSTSLLHPHMHYDWYFNPHLQSPFDRGLLLCRTTFSEAVRASLPVVLYRSSSKKQVCHVSPSSSSPPPPSSSSSSSIPSPQVKLQDLNVIAPLPSPTICVATSASTTSPCLSVSLIKPPSSSSSSSSLQPSNVAAYILQHHCQKKAEAMALLQTPSPIAAESDDGKDYGDQCTECAICICEFQDEQEVRELPECRHIFHKHCIDGWILHNHHSCPLCRSSLLTPAVALQEMLREQSELSQHLSTWRNHLQDGEEAYQYYAHHHQQQLHQAFFFTLQ